MSSRTTGLREDLHAYVLARGVREAAALARLRQETKDIPEAGMQIAPEQGAFMALLVELLDARNYLEVGVFTGYSSLAVALALPNDGQVTALDISEEWTAIARRRTAARGYRRERGRPLLGIPALYLSHQHERADRCQRALRLPRRWHAHWAAHRRP